MANCIALDAAKLPLVSKCKLLSPIPKILLKVDFGDCASPELTDAGSFGF